MSCRIPDAEGAAYPWWAIIDPHQNLSLLTTGVHAVANMITGPFTSRASAEAELNTHRHRYTKHACVYCMSGHWSPDWRAICKEPTP